LPAELVVNDSARTAYEAVSIAPAALSASIRAVKRRAKLEHLRGLGTRCGGQTRAHPQIQEVEPDFPKPHVIGRSDSEIGCGQVKKQAVMLRAYFRGLALEIEDAEESRPS